MSIIHRRAGKTSTIIALLLGAILSGIVALIIIVSNQSGSTAAGGSGAPKPYDPSTATSKPAVQTAGETKKREDVQQAGVTPPAPTKPLADTTRIRQTYARGQRIRVVLKGGADCPATAKDWGIETKMQLHYAAETEMIRQVESNDGTTLVEIVEFRKARSLGVFCQLEDVRIDIGPAGTLILLGLDCVSDSPGVWSSLQGASLAPVLKGIPAIGSFANDLLSDQATKAFTYVDSLQGKKVKITYINGKGVTDLTPIDCYLTSDEQSFLFSIGLLADGYVMEDLHCKEGDRWQIDAQNFLPVLDPSLRSSLTGQLTCVRRQDEGTPSNLTAKLELTGGLLTIASTNRGSETHGYWEPQGDMWFSFANNIVTQANLRGNIDITKRSTDHLIFEARFSVKPSYRVDYFCEVLK